MRGQETRRPRAEPTQASEAGIQTISQVFGNSTAGGAYIPGKSEYEEMVKEGDKEFLRGPPLGGPGPRTR